MHLSGLALPHAVVRGYKRLNRTWASVASTMYRQAVGDGRRAAVLRHLLGRRAESLFRFSTARRQPPRDLVLRQRIFHLDCGPQFHKVAFEPPKRRLLRLEFDNWRRLQSDPRLSGFVVDDLRLEETPCMTVLTSQALKPIEDGQLVEAAQSVLEGFSQAGRVLPDTGMAEVRQGIDFVRSLNDGRLPCRFADEQALEEALAVPLRVGPSHQDLHRGNLMLDIDERFRLVDLRKVRVDGVQALDILTCVVKEQVRRQGGNLIAAAHHAQDRDWDLPEYRPLLSLVDLPRPLWGQLFVLRLLGRRAAQGRAPANGGHLARGTYRLLLAPIFRHRWKCILLIVGAITPLAA